MLCFGIGIRRDRISISQQFVNRLDIAQELLSALRPLPHTIGQMVHTENKFATGYGHNGIWSLPRIECHGVSARRQGRGGSAGRGIVPPRA
jgi:hypothetical protein